MTVKAWNYFYYYTIIHQQHYWASHSLLILQVNVSCHWSTIISDVFGILYCCCIDMFAEEEDCGWADLSSQQWAVTLVTLPSIFHLFMNSDKQLYLRLCWGIAESEISNPRFLNSSFSEEGGELYLPKGEHLAILIIGTIQNHQIWRFVVFTWQEVRREAVRQM